MAVYLSQGNLLLIEKKKFSGQIMSNNFTGCIFISIESDNHILFGHIDIFSSLDEIHKILDGEMKEENPKVKLVSKGLLNNENNNARSLKLLLSNKKIIPEVRLAPYCPFSIIVDVSQDVSTKYNLINGGLPITINKQQERIETERTSNSNSMTVLCGHISEDFAIGLMCAEDQKFFSSHLKKIDDKDKLYKEVIANYRAGCEQEYFNSLKDENTKRFVELLFKFQIQEQAPLLKLIRPDINDKLLFIEDIQKDNPSSKPTTVKSDKEPVTKEQCIIL